MKAYINILVDTKEGESFFRHNTSCRLIGERYGSYCCQFPSLSSATKAIKKYREHLADKNIRSASKNYADSYFADIINHTAFSYLKLEEFKRDICFYLD